MSSGLKRLVTLLAICLISASGPALACCGDGAVAAAGAKAAGATVSGAVSTVGATITTMLAKIDMTIGQGFGKLYTELAKQTAQQKVFHEGLIAAQNQLYMEKARAQAALATELSPRACFEAAAGTATGVAVGEMQENLADLNARFAERTLFTPNTVNAINEMYRNHVQKYCSEQDAQLGRCSSPAPKQLQNADIRADTIYAVSSLTPEQIEAAQSLVNNIANPLPTQNIPKDWEKTQQGRAYIAGQYIEQARASVAAHSLNAAVAMRTPVSGLGSAAMLNKADVSPLELMESQIRGRFESPQWYAMLAGFRSPENLLRELNKMKAVELWMQLQSFKQMERVEAILATQLAMDVKRDSELRLQQARAAAARAGGGQ